MNTCSRIAALALAIGASVILTAPTSTAAQGLVWTYARSDHFEVYTTAGDRRAREALAYFERAHAFFTEFLQISPRTGAPTRLIIFSGDRQFEPYRLNDVAIAYYQPGPDRDSIVMRAMDADTAAIVVHEYVHLINRHSGGVYPVWLNEGLAEFFSTMDPQRNSVTLGVVPVGRLLHLRGGAPLLSLERLFSVGHDSPEYNTESHAGVFYSQSWAMTHMLLVDDLYRAGAVNFLNLVAAGESSAAAIEKVYGRSLAVVMRDLDGYIRQDAYRTLSAAYKPPPRLESVPTRRVEAFEGALVAATLLASRRDRETEARAAFDRLIEQQPDNLELIESYASFEIRRGQPARALPLLTKAVDLGSTTPSVYNLLASQQPDRAEPLLAKAFSLAPDDVSQRLRYASTLIGANNTSRALELLTEVKRPPHESAFQYFLLFASALVRENETDAARLAVNMALRYAEPGAQEERATRLLQAIDEHTAARSRPARAVTAPPPGPPRPLVIPPAADLPSRPVQISPEAINPDLIVITGRIRHVNCGAGAPVVQVETDGRLLQLRIDDPLAIIVRGRESHTVDLPCGAHNATLRIGYVPRPDFLRDIAGDVRLLDYSKQ